MLEVTGKAEPANPRSMQEYKVGSSIDSIIIWYSQPSQAPLRISARAIITNRLGPSGRYKLEVRLILNNELIDALHIMLRPF